MSGADLLALTAELIDIPSVSNDEKRLADRVVAELESCRALDISRVGDNVVARTDLGRPWRVFVAGHLDTVPGAGNETARLDGDTVRGLGACDMKGGLAVLLDLARTIRDPAVDVTWCFYAREELSRDVNGLGELWCERPDLMAADVAILAEPTGAIVEAGCQGTLRMAVHLGGVRAHTARPFSGRNAVHRLAPVLDRVARYVGREVDIDGCTFAEQLQAVHVEGGVAGNVVPDHAVVVLNHRFAPDRSSKEAIDALGHVFDGLVDEALGDRVEVLDAVDGAPPALDHPLLRSIVERTGEVPRAKVGWTDVATMWAHGIPATNFGPGDPLLAHHPDELVTRASLERARDLLGAVLRAGAGQ